VKRMQTVSRPTIVVDANGLILGRMCSVIAKKLLTGEEVIVVNAEKAVLSGRRKSKLLEAHVFLEVGKPVTGPFHYRRPDRILRRTVRGMLPFKKPKGKQAYKRLKVFLGLPDDLKDQKTVAFGEAQANRLTCPFFTLGEYAKEIGWNNGE
jgi:large subunit ribosomal protein L13